MHLILDFVSILLFYIGYIHVHTFVDMFIDCMSEIGNLIDENIVYNSAYTRCFIIHIDSLCKRNMQLFLHFLH